jgi:hypothetical protein
LVGLVIRIGQDAAFEELEAPMPSLSGTMWKLIGASAFDEEGHELTPPLGELPMGFAMFEAERMIVAVTDGRLSLPPDVPARAFVAS